MTCDVDGRWGQYVHNPLYNRKDNLIEAALTGDPTPLITDINQNQYKMLYIDMAPWNGSVYTNKQISNFTKILSQIPNVQELMLVADISSLQATDVAKNIVHSNICAFSLTSDAIQNNMTNYVNALSESKVTNFELNGPLSNYVATSLKFENTHFDSLMLFDAGLSNKAFVSLFNNLYHSPIKEVIVYSDTYLSATNLDMIDFSRTNIHYLEIYDAIFEGDALAHFHLKNSPVTEFVLNGFEFTADDLGYLSLSLQASNVQLLSLEPYFFKSDALSGLHLQETQIETLQFHPDSWEKIDLSKLDLHHTKVSTLDLSFCELSDKDIIGLNLKDSNVQHLNLDYNHFTEKGIELIKEIIADTSVQDVSLNSVIWSLGEDDYYINTKLVLTNERIAPATSKETLMLSDVLSDQAMVKDNSTHDFIHPLPCLIGPASLISPDQITVSEQAHIF